MIYIFFTMKYLKNILFLLRYKDMYEDIHSLIYIISNVLHSRVVISPDASGIHVVCDTLITHRSLTQAHIYYLSYGHHRTSSFTAVHISSQNIFHLYFLLRTKQCLKIYLSFSVDK